MLLAAAWTVFALGLAHIVVGLVFFRHQFAGAIAEGWIGRFQGIDSRRVLGAVALAGVSALPKSPFWAVLALAPVFIAGGHGWLG